MNDSEPNRKETALNSRSEVLSERWSVVSFDKCEASHLTYADAARKMAELDLKRVAGLCIITDEAAARMAAKIPE
jgi:hypothetical protein